MIVFIIGALVILAVAITLAFVIEGHSLNIMDLLVHRIRGM